MTVDVNECGTDPVNSGTMDYIGPNWCMGKIAAEELRSRSQEF